MGKRTLVPFDGSEFSKRALDFALSLAMDTDEIFLIHVQKPYYDGVEKIGNVSKEALDAFYEEEGRKILGEAKNREIPANIKIENIVRIGLPAIEITKAAKELSAHSIVMGSRGMSPVVNHALGSVTYSVLHLATCPVTIVPYT